MEKKPLVSVIIPLFNRENFIKEAIESILKQTVKDIEVLLIDDASTDASISVVKGIYDPRIKIFSKQKNEGVASAINLGLREAKGKYIARMDSDDISYPTRLEKQLKILQENSNVVICGTWIETSTGEILKFKERHFEIQADMLNRCAVSMGTAFWDAEKLKGIFLKEGLRHGEDYEFWSRVISRGHFYNIPEPLLFYRTHNTQLSKLNKSKQIEMDAEIKLSFFKSVAYETSKFPDELIKKNLTFNRPISVEEFQLFLHWLGKLKQLNSKRKVFTPTEFNSVIDSLRKNILFDLFFKKNKIGIDKSWRKKAIIKLSPKDLIYILQGKLRERIKLIGKA